MFMPWLQRDWIALFEMGMNLTHQNPPPVKILKPRPTSGSNQNIRPKTLDELAIRFIENSLAAKPIGANSGGVTASAVLTVQ